jgi:hypothetical protein
MADVSIIYLDDAPVTLRSAVAAALEEAKIDPRPLLLLHQEQLWQSAAAVAL